MKQRPRPLLACSSCNNIYCRVCLESRWKDDRWTAGLAEGEAWQCPKCVGDCCCKACGKGNRSSSSSAPRKRSLPSSVPEEAGAPTFDAPAMPARSTKRPASAGVLPGRQPSVPAGFQSQLVAAGPANPKYPRNQMGTSLWNTI